MSRHRWLARVAVAAAAASLVLGQTEGAWAARRPLTPTRKVAKAAATADAVIGVDGASPQGHNFMYTTFYPSGLGPQNTPVTIHAGQIVDFAFNPGSLDGFHTATLLHNGETPSQAWAANPFLIPDGDDGPGAHPNQNIPVFLPTDPTCGESADNPCAFSANGTTDMSSGGLPTFFGPDFFVKINLTPALGPGATNDVPIVCLIHPGMQGKLTIVDDATATTTASANQANADAQYQADTSAALVKEASVSTGSVTNGDGSKTWTMWAGTATPDTHVEILEMLPRNLPVKKGDSVKWTTGTNIDIHTVTFPYGLGSDPVDPFALPPECEGGPPDTPANPAAGPPDFGCAPGTAEFPLLENAVGPTTITRHGYRTVASDGGVFDFGDAPFKGSEGSLRLNKPVVGQAATSTGQGYWNVAADGGVFSHGDAQFFGSTGSIKLNQPMVGMAATSTGGGYYLVAADGGIFNYGDAPFLGSTGSLKLNKPVVGMDIARSLFNGPGYYLVASDGGVFAFGTPFFGSAGSLKLNKPVVGMATTPTGNGYWLVASDGGIFAYGDAGFFGSLGSLKLNQPIVGMAASPSGQGYWLVGADGGIFAFGDAKFSGSTGSLKLNKPVVGMSAMPATVTTSGLIGSAATPFPQTTSAYLINDQGSFTYQCRVHDNMVGVITST